MLEYNGSADKRPAAAMDMDFTIPIGRHGGTSLRNLVHLIYSRGDMIGRATGGTFGADEGLVEALRDDACTYTRANFLAALADYEAHHGEALRGVRITGEAVSFTGFGRAEDMESLVAYGRLAVLMNEQALSQKRIRAKRTDCANEKYAMRSWLNCIGMSGAAFKGTRAVLMRKLSGHAAIRIPKDDGTGE